MKKTGDTIGDLDGQMRLVLNPSEIKALFERRDWVHLAVG
jgi:hypothetical protein